MRPDLYRPVTIAVPKLKYNAALVLRDVFKYEPVSLQVAEIDGKNVGAVFAQSLSRSQLSWSAFEKDAYLDNIVVLKEYRRQGIGMQLLDAATDWARKTGHSHMWGKIITDNKTSLAFFAQAGFSADSQNVGMHL